MYIKKFNKFLEDVKVTQNDPPEIASDKTSYNQLDANIKEFLAKKVTIDNIYLTYTDEKDLITKLYAQKFISNNTSDKKKINFTNPLIGLYAEISGKKRELKNLNDKINDQTKTIDQKNQLIQSNPSLKDSTQEEISIINTTINDEKKQVSQLNSDITALGKTIDLQLKEMKDTLINSKKRIDSANKY